MSEEKKKDGLNIELTEEVAEGIYSNLAIINHSPLALTIYYILIVLNTIIFIHNTRTYII